MMQSEGLKIEGSFPTVITSEKKCTYHEFIHQLRGLQPQLQQLLLERGALLFRGFPVTDASSFSDVIESLGLGEFVNYIGGDSPRDIVEKKIYTSTEAPPSFHIPLHQELSYIKNFPRHIYFFCEIAAPVGGATVIGDARRIYEAVDPDVRNRFQMKGLQYISRYYHKSKIMDWVNHIQRSHKSWIEVFETQDKKTVEKLCIDNDFVWRWLKKDWLEIKQTRPAVHVHPKTQEKVWFNQAHLYDFNSKLLGWQKYFLTKLFYIQKTTLLHEIKFADGTTIPKKDLFHLLDVIKENTVAYPWQKGDVMVLDNILAMHGRAVFQGKRRVLTAMTS